MGIYKFSIHKNREDKTNLLKIIKKKSNKTVKHNEWRRR